ncbi:MAG: hypothetical protein IKA11_00100 [Clostridia bacterium]|nr:hypothetical protein [Clostridia bacterium]
MKKIFIKFISLLLSITFLVSMAGCVVNNNDEKEDEVNMDGIKTYNNQEEFVLSSWLSPDIGKKAEDGSYPTAEKLWGWYAESGLNEMTIFPACKEDENYLKVALAMCKKYGIKAQILMRNSTERFSKNWTELLAGYEDIVSGFDVWDEPYGYKEHTTGTDTYRPDIGDLAENGVPYVLQNFPGKSFTVTLWPNYANKNQLGMPDGQGYDDYVKLYAETILPLVPEGTRRWIGTDFYAYYKTRFDGALLSNLEVLQKYGGQYGADVYLYIQTICDLNRWRAPNRQEMALQYYTALAYGVKGLYMYCYQHPAGGQSSGIPDEKTYSMLTDGYSIRYNEATGEYYQNEYERTDMYYSVQALNNELEVLSKAYMDFKWQGVLTVRGTKNNSVDDFSDLSYSLTSYEGINSYTATENAIIGCFKDNEGNNGYMITNYSNPIDLKDSDVDIDFGSATRAWVYANGECKAVKLEGGHYKATIGGGNGYFVIPFI